MEFEGKLISKSAIEEVGENALKKITIVLEENSDKEYKNSIAIDLFKDKIDLVKDVKQNEVIVAHLNIKAKEYNGRQFNNISAWRIDKVTAEEKTAGENVF